MPPSRALYHSIRLSKRIPAGPSPTRSDRWLWSYPPSRLWQPGHLRPRPRATKGYRHATISSLIPFNSPPRADSSGSTPDSIRRLVVELTSILTLAIRTPLTQNYAYRELQRASTMPPLRALYHSIRLSERIPMRPPPTLADSWLEIYPSFSSADSYRHATASYPIPFDWPQRADSDKMLPDSI